MLRHAARSLSLLLAAAGMSSCVETTAPVEALDARAFDPPAEYATWWSEMEQCSGRRGQYGRVRWFEVPGVYSFEYKGSHYAGYWWATHEIVLAGGLVRTERIVRHEMLHDLLHLSSHPPEFFEDLCGTELNPVYDDPN